MGGAMDVWETEAHPWLVDEKRAIKEWAINRTGRFSAFAWGFSFWRKPLAARSAWPASRKWASARSSFRALAGGMA